MAYDDFLRGKVAAEIDGMLGSVIRQVYRPCDYHPVFHDNPAVALGKAYARRLLGADVQFAFDLLLYKEPGNSNETPWHQDAAYFKVPLAEAGTLVSQSAIQFWIPLDDVDEDTGCMRFIGGRQKEPLMQHYVASDAPDNRQRLLALTNSGEPARPEQGRLRCDSGRWHDRAPARHSALNLSQSQCGPTSTRLRLQLRERRRAVLTGRRAFTAPSARNSQNVARASDAGHISPRQVERSRVGGMHLAYGRAHGPNVKTSKGLNGRPQGEWYVIQQLQHQVSRNDLLADQTAHQASGLGLAVISNARKHPGAESLGDLQSGRSYTASSPVTSTWSPRLACGRRCRANRTVW